MFQLSITSFFCDVDRRCRRLLPHPSNAIDLFIFIYHDHLCLINKIFIFMNHAESSTISTAIVRLFVANDPHPMSAAEVVNSNRAKWVKVTRPYMHTSFYRRQIRCDLNVQKCSPIPNPKLCPQRIKTDPIKIIGHRFAHVAGATRR